MRVGQITVDGQPRSFVADPGHPSGTATLHLYDTLPSGRRACVAIVSGIPLAYLHPGAIFRTSGRRFHIPRNPVGAQ